MVILCLIPYAFWSGQASAQSLGSRQVIISNAAPSEIANDTFNMTLTSTDLVGSIDFQYCSNSPLTQESCTAPTDMSASGVALTAQSGNTGFSVDPIDSTANSIIITRAPSAGVLTPSSYTFTGITNPSYYNRTTYVRISVYSSIDASGAADEFGAVAFSTVRNFTVGAYIPPFLDVCVALTVSVDCSTSVGNSIDMGILTPLTTGDSTSQISAATNDNSGYSVYVMGPTMTSGNNIIPSSSTPTPSKIGLSRFAINLRKNTSPVVGADPDGNGTAQPLSSYNTPNLYSYNSGDEIASSDTSTDFTRMTVSYVVNVASTQPPGVYATTLTYVASGQY
jgi:hypothetical protein